MKRFLLFALLCLPLATSAQGLKYSHAYLGALLQNSRPGGSLVLSYGFNKYLGVGAGIDVLSYRRNGYSDATSFIPYYLDVRVRYPFKWIAPYIVGQFGKQAYNYKLADLTDVSTTIRERGKLFYGLGLGISSIAPKGRIAVFLSLIYRHYKFKYDPKNFNYNGLQFEDRTHGPVILTGGIVF